MSLPHVLFRPMLETVVVDDASALKRDATSRDDPDRLSLPVVRVPGFGIPVKVDVILCTADTTPVPEELELMFTPLVPEPNSSSRSSNRKRAGSLTVCFQTKRNWVIVGSPCGKLRSAA